MVILSELFNCIVLYDIKSSQPQFLYSACGPFTRHKEKIKEFKQTGDTHYIYRNELDKACFQHNSAYADHKRTCGALMSTTFIK